MEIKDLQVNRGGVDVVADVVEKEEPRTFEKFGKVGKVCKAKVKDASGEVKITLWNNDVDLISVGDRIHLKNGWCSEYQGEKQVSAGKFGKIEIVEHSGEKTVYTNDPQFMSGKVFEEENADEEADEEAPLGEEEPVE